MNGIEIQIKDLNLILSGSEILRNINLTVKSGEIHCLVGPNGGGKTSFLRCVLGQMPFSGSIKMNYEEDKIIGYVPQVLDFERTLPITVEDFMAMTYQTRPCFIGISKKYKDEVDNLLRKLNVFEKKKRLLGNLSGGERQRVLLAQALFPKPNLLILDEPLTGIDKIGEDYFKNIIKELKEEGITILWIHHNLAQVRELADTVTCIKKEVIFSGDPKEELKEDKIMRIFE
ncbi:metal ABC transporter ATP-binding protein [Fusobacterium massiliense]|uniref:metal ABC transporter ATP-binding protein n=1 Tax=Fusobacterium massiliense TaxID=1852365 RepID=UPI0028D856A9|nr:metal ABC transporter ATP-binding protein [Fusobacterium massiliense]